MAAKRKDLPEDPRDYYVHNPCSLAELAKLYKGQKGCSLPNLKLRCSREKWVKQLETFDAEIKERADEIVIQAKAEEIASQAHVVSNIVTHILTKIEKSLPDMAAFKKRPDQNPNRYFAITYKACLENFLETQKANAAGGSGGDECGFIGLPGIDADAL